MENRANSGSKEASEEDTAIAAALQNSLFYSQHPSNFLYSQWLASRNTSALFGLQGLSNFCHFIIKRKSLFFLYSLGQLWSRTYQIRVVAFNVPQLTQASFLQKNWTLQNAFFYICNA